MNREPSRRPRVAVLRTNPRDSSLARLLSFLEPGRQVACFVWDRDNGFADHASAPNVRFVRNRVRGDYYSWRTLSTIALLQPWFVAQTLRYRPDVVHAMDLDTALAGLVSARIRGVPFVYQCLDPYHTALPASWPRVLARVAAEVEDRIVAAADLFVITDLLRLSQHPSAITERTVEVPNIPIYAIPQLVRAATRPLVVGYVGSLGPHRGLEETIRAVENLGGDVVELVIGGYGPWADRIRRTCAGSPNIRFIGPVSQDDIAEVQSRFDVFIAMVDPQEAGYRWGSANKLFESMAFGRPVIVAEGTMSATHVEATRHGIVLRYGDIPGLTRLLADLAVSPTRLAELSAAARRAWPAWRPETIGPRLDEAYGRLLTHGLRRPKRSGFLPGGTAKRSTR